MKLTVILADLGGRRRVLRTLVFVDPVVFGSDEAKPAPHALRVRSRV
jgi:hypothetical protein